MPPMSPTSPQDSYSPFLACATAQPPRPLRGASIQILLFCHIPSRPPHLPSHPGQGLGIRDIPPPETVIDKGVMAPRRTQRTHVSFGDQAS